MKNIEFLYKLLPILSPVFYSLKDREGNEFIFLNAGNKLNNIRNRIVDKTTVEAIQNCFLLFGKQNKKSWTEVYKTSLSISKNLLNSLKFKYPEKEFIVFLEIKMNDVTKVRFHQLWKDEVPYFDVSQLKQKGVKIYEFRT